MKSKIAEPELDVAILSRLAAMPESSAAIPLSCVAAVPESSAAIPLSRVAAVPELGLARGRQVYRQKYQRETVLAASGK